MRCWYSRGKIKKSQRILAESNVTSCWKFTWHNSFSSKLSFQWNLCDVALFGSVGPTHDAIPNFIIEGVKPAKNDGLLKALKLCWIGAKGGRRSKANRGRRI